MKIDVETTEKLNSHKGHELEVRTGKSNNGLKSLSIECITCQDRDQEAILVEISYK